MSVVISVRVRKEVKEELEKMGINVAEEVRNFLEEMVWRMKVKKELYTIIAEHSGRSFEQVEKDADRDYWMTSEEAVEYGMIDEILVRK